jgi:hypothetical protein
MNRKMPGWECREGCSRLHHYHRRPDAPECRALRVYALCLRTMRRVNAPCTVHIRSERAYVLSTMLCAVSVGVGVDGGCGWENMNKQHAAHELCTCRHSVLCALALCSVLCSVLCLLSSCHCQGASKKKLAH